MRSIIQTTLKYLITEICVEKQKVGEMQLGYENKMTYAKTKLS